MKDQDAHLLAERAAESARIAPRYGRRNRDVAEIERRRTLSRLRPGSVFVPSSEGENIRRTGLAAVCAIPARHLGICHEADADGLSRQSKRPARARQKLSEVLHGNADTAL